MTPKFKIRAKSVSSRSQYQFEDIMTPDVLTDILQRINQTSDYEVEWIDERNEGRYIILELEGVHHIISISNYGLVEGRNQYMQSVATAYTDYLNYKKNNKDVEVYFSYYSVYYEGNNKTNLLKFYYRLMKTFNCTFLNEEYIMSGNIINEPFNTVIDIIDSRNRLRQRNQANKSSYVTDEGPFYHFYGKTFGANSKETVLICYALSAVADKKIRLFQILDNESRSLGREDTAAIESLGKIEIVGEGYDFYDDSYELRTKAPDEIRDQVSFTYNLLDKLGEKKCAFCDCKIDRLIHAAHVWPIAAIKREEGLSLEEKKQHAIDADNGLWLCQNHHKLFDTNILNIVDGETEFKDYNDLFNLDYLNYITTNNRLDNSVTNDNFNYYLNKRINSY